MSSAKDEEIAHEDGVRHSGGGGTRVAGLGNDEGVPRGNGLLDL
jgi:hypothetical protein